MRRLLLLVAVLALPASAAADAIPECPRNHHPHCEPTDYRHGCGGCVPDEPEEPEEPEAEEPAAPAEAPAEDPGEGDDEEESGGCAVGLGGSGPAWLLAPLLILALRRRR